MTHYVVAQLRFTDVAAYRRYQRAFLQVFAKFDARVLVADEGAEPLEGDWPFDKIVILAFASEDEARRFENDPDYAAIARDRRAGAAATVIRARGVELT